MEFLMENKWLAWLAVGLFFLVLELVTTALVSIWFVPAAIVSCIVSLFLDSVLWQIIIFIVLSAIFMVLFRSIYKNKLKQPHDVVKQDDKLIGKSAVTTEPTDIHGGKILVGDIYWRAVTNGESIPENTPVIITGVNSTTLVIKKEN